MVTLAGTAGGGSAGAAADSAAAAAAAATADMMRRATRLARPRQRSISFSCPAPSPFIGLGLKAQRRCCLRHPAAGSRWPGPGRTRRGRVECHVCKCRIKLCVQQDGNSSRRMLLPVRQSGRASRAGCDDSLL